jgi:hypothetical protein
MELPETVPVYVMPPLTVPNLMLPPPTVPVMPGVLGGAESAILPVRFEPDWVHLRVKVPVYLPLYCPFHVPDRPLAALAEVVVLAVVAVLAAALDFDVVVELPLLPHPVAISAIAATASHILYSRISFPLTRSTARSSVHDRREVADRSKEKKPYVCGARP